MKKSITSSFDSKRCRHRTVKMRPVDASSLNSATVTVAASNNTNLSGVAAVSSSHFQQVPEDTPDVGKVSRFRISTVSLVSMKT